MTTIDELDEMDFVNWDAAGAATGLNLDLDPVLEGPHRPSMVNDDEAIDLVLENATGDEWSFWALQHFESSNLTEDPSLMTLNGPLPMESTEEPLSALYWEHPEAPCRHCALGGYECKRIQEGRYKGYCTSCVALRCWCSFGPAGNTAGSEAGTTFPANPWPIMGDRPATSILREDDLDMTIPTTMEPGLDGEGQQASPKPQAKIGARFSRESARILKNWVATHSRHPYPTEEEKESLQKLTGLNKTQITNWLANARRRGKIMTTRSTSPAVGRGYASAIDIPKRKGTPGPLESMNPLQRWANSPPENEPASVTAIARAVTASSSNLSSSSGLTSPHISGYSDDGSSRSLCNQSSASSFSNSHGSSGGSFASSFSHQSRGSFGSIPSFVRSNRGRRRRRRAPPKRAEETLQQPAKTFQCTFCTDTFRTKHDWQRHEKSLHLSLERWVCSPDGPRAVCPENGLPSCVFCGESNPDDAHIESHNFSGCTERSLEERTFYRKDHLRQHLKLVHNVKFVSWSMDKWRVASPEIRSRCGFCGIVMDSWTMRVDHLAEHFKTGNTMADWKGDWGFDLPVLDMLENSIPPYLIHDERNSPLPYLASSSSPATPNNAYELIKMEIQYWAGNWKDEHNRMPADEEVQLEACRIIFGAEVLSREPLITCPSWLRDLVVSNPAVTNAASYRAVRGQSEGKAANLRINGKDNIFESCEMENQLQEFVKARQLLGLTAMDRELQTEACRIIGRMEETSINPSDDIANWLLRLINSSQEWLTDFRRRAGLPRSEDVSCSDLRSKDPRMIDSTIHNYSRLERELGEYVHVQRSLGLEPDDDDLQRQARIIIYETDDAWNQTAADDADWLANFRARHPLLTADAAGVTVLPPLGNPFQLPATSSSGGPSPSMDGTTAIGDMATPSATSSSLRHLRTGPFFLNDANCYRRVEKGLRKWIQATMSPHNPNRHIPTDEEIQHQARWIVYDDDDPWNQTAADNAEWLQRFKREAGILPAESGPGLPHGTQWSAEEGGTGFAPPYLAPNPEVVLLPFENDSKIYCREEPVTKGFEPTAATANRFLQSFMQRYPRPAKIFCSRELEKGLTGYVRCELETTGGVFPSDERIRQRAREIMDNAKTPCDDPVLLGKFKAHVQNTLGKTGGAASSPRMAMPTLPTTTATAAVGASGITIAAPVPLAPSMGLNVDLDLALGLNPLASFSSGLASGSGSTSLSTSPDKLLLPTDMDLTVTEQELDCMIQGVNDQFGAGSLFQSTAQPSQRSKPATGL